MSKRFENGKYAAKAMLMELGVAGTGNEQVAIVFELLDEGVAGETITYFGTFTDAALEHTLKAMRNAGWKGADMNDLSLPEEVPEVELVLANETYQGKEQTKVKWVNKPGFVGMGTPLQEDARKAFAAKMRMKIAAFDAGNKTPKPAASKPSARGGALPPEPPPHTDSDMPPV